jgi:TonB-dependent SusC/RagA subfamily outer membrane receptor
MKKFIVLVILFFPASLKAQNSPFQISGTRSGLSEDVLYVIDGKILKKVEIKRDSLNAIVSLNSIDPNDIESITILKDESAIKAYGDAGKNGVVIISTKAYLKKPKKL